MQFEDPPGDYFDSAKLVDDTSNFLVNSISAGTGSMEVDRPDPSPEKPEIPPSTTPAFATPIASSYRPDPPQSDGTHPSARAPDDEMVVASPGDPPHIEDASPSTPTIDTLVVYDPANNKKKRKIDRKSPPNEIRATSTQNEANIISLSTEVTATLASTEVAALPLEKLSPVEEETKTKESEHLEKNSNLAEQSTKVMLNTGEDNAIVALQPHPSIDVPSDVGLVVAELDFESRSGKRKSQPEGDEHKQMEIRKENSDEQPKKSKRTTGKDNAFFSLEKSSYHTWE
jgi:hypothetical protein